MLCALRLEKAFLSDTAIQRGKNIEPAGLIRSQGHNTPLYSGSRLGFDSSEGFGNLAMGAPRRYARKDARITIRIINCRSENAEAASRGGKLLPDQSLIASILS